jgi:Ras-related protein Rab-8A
MKRIKILMLGDSGVGKTSIINRLTNNEFNQTKLVSTIGIDFKVIKVVVDGTPIQVQVWDTAGSEKFHKITTTYYKGCNGIMLVYDVSNRASLENIDYWISNIKSHGSESVHVALIGNKIDIRESNHTSDIVSTAEGQAVADKYSIPYSETSAWTSTNLHESFHYLIEQIVYSEGHQSHTHSRQNSSGFSMWGIGRKTNSTSNSNEKKSPLIPQFGSRSAGESDTRGSSSPDPHMAHSPPKDKEKCVIS